MTVFSSGTSLGAGGQPGPDPDPDTTLDGLEFWYLDVFFFGVGSDPNVLGLGLALALRPAGPAARD